MSDDFASLIFFLPPSICSKLEKRFKKFNLTLISIDGVEATITSTTEKNGNNNTTWIAKIALRIFLNSSLAHLKPSNFISIGLPSNNPKRYLLNCSHPSTVRLQNIQVADGHTHTLEFTFECTQEQAEKIQKLQYIGLNGSGFFIQNRTKIDNVFSFSVHAGQNTREKTIFCETLLLDTVLTLTLLGESQISLTSKEPSWEET